MDHSSFLAHALTSLSKSSHPNDLSLPKVSIKLLVYYKQAYEHIYSSVFRFIQNPFAKENMEEWPDIEELLIASCLVGIPWSALRSERTLSSHFSSFE